ncbi:MAG: RNA polymerase sigma factor [Xanthomonadales bacterium]|nr:RNA polymerase sigma factor [Xanthomonadales bacterium]
MLLAALPSSPAPGICYARTVSAPESDESLMLRYAAGEARAFDELYARHRRTLYAFLHRSLGQSAQLDECFQEVWTRLIAARSRYRPDAKFRTWMLQIAHNLLVDTYRRQRPEVELDETTLPVEDDGPTPEQELSVFERRRRLQMAIDELPEEQRAVVDLRLRQELTLEEIAEIAGVGRETIKSRLRYAMDKLRGRLRA